MTDEDIELAIDWNGEEGAFVRVLAEVRFLDGNEGQRSIHDWSKNHRLAVSQARKRTAT